MARCRKGVRRKARMCTYSARICGRTPHAFNFGLCAREDMHYATKARFAPSGRAHGAAHEAKTAGACDEAYHAQESGEIQPEPPEMLFNQIGKNSAELGPTLAAAARKSPLGKHVRVKLGTLGVSLRRPARRRLIC